MVICNPSDVLVSGRDVALTNLDKVFFARSGLTKGDLVRYYVDLAPFVLGHVAGRPMLLKRYPDGAAGTFFYQKRAPQHRPGWVRTVHVEFPSGRSADFPVVDDAAGLAWVANLGCIDLNVWPSRVEHIERPDYLLVDLDPREEDPWEAVCEIALAARDVLDGLGLASYPKTSGATGIHILCPILPELEFPDVRRAARAIARRVVALVPQLATTTWRVADRTGVFVDYGQNARDRTIASAYSIRPTPDARASAPLAWPEVAEADPGAFTLATMRDRVADAGDLTAGMRERAVSLLPLFPRLGLKPPAG